MRCPEFNIQNHIEIIGKGKNWGYPQQRYEEFLIIDANINTKIVCNQIIRIHKYIVLTYETILGTTA